MDEILTSEDDAGAVCWGLGDHEGTIRDVVDKDALDAALIGAWGFEESGGTVVYDASSNGNNGQFSANPPTRVAGTYGNELQFNGSDNAVTIPASDSLNSIAGSFTVSLRFKYLGEGTPDKAIWTLVNKNGTGSGHNDIFHLFIYSATKRLGFRSGNGATNYEINSGVAVNDGEYHQVDLVYDNAAKTYKLYVDGQQAGDTVQAPQNWTIAQNSYPLTMGYWTTGYASYFNGVIDELQIYDRALAGNEIGERAIDAFVAHRQYDSFGNVTDESGPAVDFIFGYTGKAWDADAELYDYYHRMYDPVVGRFASADPLGLASGDANLYRYVGNNPLNYIDSTGLCGQSWSGSQSLPSSWDTRTLFDDLDYTTTPIAGLGLFNAVSSATTYESLLSSSVSQNIISPSFSAELEGGGSWLMTSTYYDKFAAGKSLLGRPGVNGGQFMTSSTQMNNLIAETGGDTTLLANRLGTTWGVSESLVRMDVSDPLWFNPQLPTSTTAGANSLFRSGGATVGEVSEVVTDLLPASHVYATRVTPTSPSLRPAIRPFRTSAAVSETGALASLGAGLLLVASDIGFQYHAHQQYINYSWLPREIAWQNQYATNAYNDWSFWNEVKVAELQQTQIMAFRAQNSQLYNKNTSYIAPNMQSQMGGKLQQLSGDLQRIINILGPDSRTSQAATQVRNTVQSTYNKYMQSGMPDNAQDVINSANTFINGVRGR